MATLLELQTQAEIIERALNVNSAGEKIADEKIVINKEGQLYLGQGFTNKKRADVVGAAFSKGNLMFNNADIVEREDGTFQIVFRHTEMSEDVIKDARVVLMSEREADKQDLKTAISKQVEQKNQDAAAALKLDRLIPEHTGLDVSQNEQGILVETHFSDRRKLQPIVDEMNNRANYDANYSHSAKFNIGIASVVPGEDGTFNIQLKQDGLRVIDPDNVISGNHGKAEGIYKSLAVLKSHVDKEQQIAQGNQEDVERFSNEISKPIVAVGKVGDYRLEQGYNSKKLANEAVQELEKKAKGVATVRPDDDGKYYVYIDERAIPDTKKSLTVAQRARQEMENDKLRTSLSNISERDSALTATLAPKADKRAGKKDAPAATEPEVAIAAAPAAPAQNQYTIEDVRAASAAVQDEMNMKGEASEEAKRRFRDTAFKVAAGDDGVLTTEERRKFQADLGNDLAMSKDSWRKMNNADREALMTAAREGNLNENLALLDVADTNRDGKFSQKELKPYLASLDSEQKKDFLAAVNNAAKGAKMAGTGGGASAAEVAAAPVAGRKPVEREGHGA